MITNEIPHGHGESDAFCHNFLLQVIHKNYREWDMKLIISTSSAWWCTVYTCTSHVYLCKTLKKNYISFKEQCTCTHNEQDCVALSF